MATAPHLARKKRGGKRGGKLRGGKSPETEVKKVKTGTLDENDGAVL